MRLEGLTRVGENSRIIGGVRQSRTAAKEKVVELIIIYSCAGHYE